MNLELLFHVLTTVWAVGEVLVALITTTGRGGGKIQDRGTQIILWIVIVASLRIDEWMHSIIPVDMPGSHSWLRPVAFAILILGLGVRARSNRRAGQSFQRERGDAYRTDTAATRALWPRPSSFLSRSGTDSPGICPSRTHMGLFCCCPRSNDAGCVVSDSC